MERLTTRHNGVAVIRDKSKHKEAMKKLARYEEAKTNGDRIRAMSDEELTHIIMCPYDTAGDPLDIMPCIKEDGTQEFVPVEKCRQCCLEWLRREV